MNSNLEISEKIDQKALRDIFELDEKITLFQKGEINNDSFRAFRLARGIYGQRQDGVNMIRIKLPFGRVTPDQLERIADLSAAYGSGNLHATTRQDIQLHYVHLANAPQLWAKLEEKGITLREACGNTIRNLTASPYAGIDPEELFDVSPYANAVFNYFLRNPVCQNLGRKFKIAFSSSDRDSAFTFIHDLGFIPRNKEVNGKLLRGFRVVLAGGLGAQPFMAHRITDFMEEDSIIPFTEACLRIFDRYGERANRHKARLKYLIRDMGLEQFLELVEKEWESLTVKLFPIDLNDYIPAEIPLPISWDACEPLNLVKFERWLRLNRYEQKQSGYYAVQIKLPAGNISSTDARKLAAIARRHASPDMRITVNQGILLKYVRSEALPSLFNALNEIGLAEPGFDTLYDITACPGTDTCNLGIASSVGLARELEGMLVKEYSDILFEKDIKIKVSGCMNGCAHHAIASIGFHGMSMKVGQYILPAMQVLLGGGLDGKGNGVIAEKIIKLPSKRIPDAVRSLLDNYQQYMLVDENFNDFFKRMGEKHFYTLLKPLGELKEVEQFHLTDWGNEKAYETKIGIGECAVPMMDMVAVIFEEVQETLGRAAEAILQGEWVEGIYYCYTALLNTGKALLLTKEKPCNNHISVIRNFDPNFIENNELEWDGSFSDLVFQINNNKSSSDFAESYYKVVAEFYKRAVAYREIQLRVNG
jgi:sulfite reductase (ferredoxin)